MWKLLVNGSSKDTSFGVGIILTSPKRYKLNYGLRFAFKVTNNVAEYEALLASLQWRKEMRGQNIEVNKSHS